MTQNVRLLSRYRKDLPNCIRYGIATNAELEGHRNCAAKLRDGTLCSGGKMSGSSFCYFHDPELEEDRAEARQKGRGSVGSVISRQTEAPVIETPEDVRKFCVETAHQIRIGDLGSREGAVIAQFMNQILKTLPEEVASEETNADKLRQMLMEEDADND